MSLGPPIIRVLQPPGAPKALKVAVAEGAESTRRGLPPGEIDRLFEALLPGRAIVRRAGGGPVARGADDIYLSVSHAASASALAVAPFPVGIDLERVDPDFDPLSIDPVVFGARDLAFVKMQAEAARRDHYYRLWTLKEARLKHLGRTLADGPLPDILGDNAPPGVGMTSVWLAQSGNRYCLSACWG
jgi:4'-phosphopantetheinyl transferase superfamily